MNLRKHLTDSKGAVILIVALMVPVFMAFCALVMDYGTWKAYSAKLQGAADASALAGAWQLDEKDSVVYETVDEFVLKNVDEGLTTNEVNSDTQPNSTGVVNIHMVPNDDRTELKVELMMRINSSFLKYFNIDTLPVHATATAKVEQGAPTSAGDAMFDFAMCAAYNTPDGYEMSNIYPHTPSANTEAAIWIDTVDVDITGDIMTNGKILFDNNQRNTLRGVVYADEDLLSCGNAIKDEFYWQNSQKIYEDIVPSVWGRYGEDGSNGRTTYTFVDGDGDPFVLETPKVFKETDNGVSSYVTTEYDASAVEISRRQEDEPTNTILKGATYDGDDKVVYRDEIDISVNANEGIKTYLETIKNMSVKDREKQHIYYDDGAGPSWGYSFNSSNANESFPNLCSGYSIVDADDAQTSELWSRWYKVVIVRGDINLSFERTPDAGDDDFAVIISLEGNIHIPNHCGNFHGVLYAPNGEVWVSGADKIEGAIVAQKIKISHNGFPFIAHNWLASGSSSSSSSGSKLVKLIK